MAWVIDLVTWPYRVVRAAVVAFRLWRQLQADADARICLGFKRQEEILSEQLREAQAGGDVSEEGRVRQLLHRVQDNELSYHQSRMADLARHVVADRAPSGVIGPDLPKLPEADRAGLDAAATALKALAPAETFEDHFMRGNAFYFAGDLHNALEEYNAALALRPDDPDTLNNRGVTLDDLARYEEALADYNRSLELRPDDPATLNNRGAALDDLERYEEALADYNRSLELRPDHPGTLNNRGAALVGLKRYQEALPDFNGSLELTPDHPDILSNRGVALAGLKRYGEALADFNRSLELRPDDPATLTNRGVALAGLKRYGEALADYNRSVELKPDHPSTLYNRACLFSLTERWSESLVDLRAAVAIDPDNRRLAREDEDFEGLRNDREWGPKFWEIVGPEDEP